MVVVQYISKHTKTLICREQPALRFDVNRVFGPNIWMLYELLLIWSFMHQVFFHTSLQWSQQGKIYTVCLKVKVSLHSKINVSSCSSSWMFELHCAEWCMCSLTLGGYFHIHVLKIKFQGVIFRISTSFRGDFCSKLHKREDTIIYTLRKYIFLPSPLNKCLEGIFNQQKIIKHISKLIGIVLRQQ